MGRITWTGARNTWARRVDRVEEIAAESRQPVTRRGRPARGRAARTAVQAAPTAERAAYRRLVLAGAAEGSGALTGWSGAGAKPRAFVAEVLAAAGLPVGWAPSAKSDVSHLGHVMNTLNGHGSGLIARRCSAAKWDRSGYQAKRRAYRSRWTVQRANGAAEVGEAGGAVICTAELRDGSSDLHIEGPADMVESLRNRYQERLDAELMQAGDITAWLARTLRDHCGAARYAVGYYVPAGGREIAERLIAAMAERWGTGWASPMLPVATGPELAAGLARGFYDELAKVAGSLATAREAATKAGKAEISAAVAARLLKDLGDVSERADAYRVLVGADALAPAIEELRRLDTEIRPLADGASIRFSLLELDGPATAEPSPDPLPAPIADRRPEPAQAAEAAPEPVQAAEAAPEPAQAGSEASRLEELRAAFKAAQVASGMEPGAFKERCSELLNGDRSPAAWLAVAERVAKAAQVAEPFVRPIELD